MDTWGLGGGGGSCLSAWSGDLNLGGEGSLVTVEKRANVLEEVKMNTIKYLSSEQVSHIFTTYSPGTIRRLAQIGYIPVACWVGREPGFSRDPMTIRALLNLIYREGNTDATEGS